jgi:hypothetical protein
MRHELFVICGLSLLSGSVQIFAKDMNAFYRKNDNPSKYKVEAFDLGDFKISGAYPAMTGPTKKKVVKLSSEKKSSSIWIKGVRVDVYGKNMRPEPLALLCHAWITLDDKMTYKTDNEGLLTISEGMAESLFPVGFGMKIENPKDYDIELLAQALNDDPTMHKDLGYRFKITYLEESQSGRELLKPLKQVTLSAVGPAVRFKDGEMCQAEEGSGTGMGVHFVVPPGQHRFSRTYPKGTFSSGERIHFIKVHLHQYGDRVAFHDKTTNTLLWEGAAKHENNIIHSVDSYSSTTGIQVYPDHEYEIIGTYINPTKKNVDGMAVLRMYRASI